MPTNEDYLWLETIKDEAVTQWVEEQNRRTEKRFTQSGLFQILHQEQLDILTAEDRTAFGQFFQGYYWDLWQDSKYERGLWRRCTPEEYAKENPKWETILDLDALAEKEGKDWTFHGGVRFGYTSTRRILWLSEGGSDTVVGREFDTATKEFVPGGFFLPPSKGEAVALDQDTLLLSADFGPGSLTNSGYPRMVKRLRRGVPFQEAESVYEGESTDMAVWCGKITQGENKTYIIYRKIDFFNQEYLLLDPVTLKTKKIPMPTSVNLNALVDGWAYAQNRETFALKEEEIPADTIFRFQLDSGLEANFEIIHRPTASQSIESCQVTFQHQVYLNLLEDVSNRVILLEGSEQGWQSKDLPFPKNSKLFFDLEDENDPGSPRHLYVTSFLDPYAKYLVQKDYSLRLLKQQKARFDASNFQVTQGFAQSLDGTRIPYFLLEPKSSKRDGQAPTILNGYGGFNISLGPGYNPNRGKSWLERGGTYVVANIRGGGEYGAKWHQSALKQNRQRAYEDFISVAEDLISKGITSPDKLGISGGSNGGLLVGAVVTQRPELFGAVHCDVPLLDMLRYHKLLAGASWMAEYGDPDDPEEGQALRAYSPFHNLKEGLSYPEILFTTSAADDRVHPGHARKMAAKMEDLGHKVYFWENHRGGHGGATGPQELAWKLALAYSYFWEMLGGS